MKSKIIVFITILLSVAFIESASLQAAAEPFVTTPSGFNEHHEPQPRQSAAAYWSGVRPKSVMLEVDVSGGRAVLSQDQKLLIFYGRDSIKVLNLNSGILIRTFPLGADDCASFSPGSKRLLTYDHDGVIKIWNAETVELISELTRPVAQHLIFSKDGNVFAVHTQEGAIEVYALRTGKETYELLRQRTAKKNITRIEFIDEQTLSIFKVNNHRRISLWNVIDDKVSQRFKFPMEGGLSSPRLSKSPHIIRVLATPQKFIVLDERGQTISEMQRITTAAQTILRCTEDMTLLALGFEDGTIGLWNIQTGQLIQRLTGHVSKITCLSCSDDGRIIVSCTDHGVIRIWRAGK